MNCDKCGKSMTNEAGETIIAFYLQINSLVPESVSKAFRDKQLGKYAKKEAHAFCYECMIDAIMGS